MIYNSNNLLNTLDHSIRIREAFIWLDCKGPVCEI